MKNIKNIISKITIIICITVCFTNCGIYTPYTRPEVKTGGLYRDAELNPADTNNIGNIGWRDFFTDKNLQELIEKGLQNNVDIKSARLHIEQATAALVAAKLSFLPSFALPFEGTVGSFRGGTAQYTYTLPIAASWEIDVFGKLFNAKQRTKAMYEQTLEVKQLVQTQVMAGIANLYYTLLMLDAQYEIMQSTAQNWQDNVSMMRELKQAGMSNEAAVAQSEATYFAIEAGLFDVSKAIYEIENTLSVLLGEVPGQIKRGKLSEQNMLFDIKTGIPLQLLANRPDIKVAELGLKQAFYATNEARAAFYPSLVINANGSWTNLVNNTIVNPAGILLGALGQLTQPLFARGALTARLKISKTAREEALLHFQQSLLNAGREVSNAMKQIETAKSKRAFRQQQIAALEMATASSEALYNYGSAVYLDVLYAQQTLLAAQITQTTDRFEEIQGIINLYRALGGGR
ncbi:MAG: TolC family protein [Bacteroidales bacterium]|nr:TolC family protein [Bacteroidales bacterium]